MISNQPSPDTGLALALLSAISDATRDPMGGVTREGYGPGEQRAHDIVRAVAEREGLRARVDPAGNLYMTLPGADPSAKRLVIGSHLDSVRQGGDYDGAAGVAAGLAVAVGLRKAGFLPGRDIEVMAIRSEEGGAWFPTPFPGSRAALGLMQPDALATCRMDGTLTLEEAMRQSGFDPDWCRSGQRELGPDNVQAYVELHIEQGLVLEEEDRPVGIVFGLPGNRRHRFARVVGEYNHSGTTPRRHRRDAVLAAAELAYRLEQSWIRLEAAGHDLVVTFCVFETGPQAAFGKVPGEVAFKLDVRSGQQAALDALYRDLHALVAEIEAQRDVRFELGAEQAREPVPMDPTIVEALAQAATDAAVPFRRMASGGGHDAQSFVAAGIPAGMLFVRSQNGSHNPDEAMRPEDFEAACRVLMTWTVGAAGR
ncbi:Zn-dependent hydrolase [Sabulicella glaciei]|uniref:Zn-dependent hydrolase n=1 Tax=Sabulicella glaciei TaxID=2984948 RepID=A0ABT3P212_9PROT|nr:Zn-dependent hydrolase [Roseococcus sp. MDT2-1-1]MCW8088454.1 Zn-dependent hydrolase [Roseococcus sp. MDT2-1-1]